MPHKGNLRCTEMERLILDFPAKYSEIKVPGNWLIVNSEFRNLHVHVMIAYFIYLFIYLFIFVFCLFFVVVVAISWAAPAAYGGSQARGWIGAVATSLRQSHSNAGSEPRLQPTPQLTATPDR